MKISSFPVVTKGQEVHLIDFLSLHHHKTSKLAAISNRFAFSGHTHEKKYDFTHYCDANGFEKIG